MKRSLWGAGAPWSVVAMYLCFLGVTVPAHADVATATIPDGYPREDQGKTQPHVPVEHPPPSDVLDGFYIWLGPMGAAGHIDMKWDSLIGASLSVMRVREHAPLGVIGGSFGASKWTERDGGQLWLDGLVATSVLGYMVGVTAGPLVELAELHHPRFGGSIGVWGFAGFAPFARIGAVQDLGAFVEVGIHLALPVFRR